MKLFIKNINRNFIKKPIISLINLFGLSISLVFVIILSVYCYSELTVDSHHVNGDQVYLIGKPGAGTYTPAILKEHIDDKIPEIESTVRIGSTWKDPVFQTGNKEPITSDLIFTDKNFFDFFTYTEIEGDLKTALDCPKSVAISKNLSSKLFGKKNALGKSIKINNGKILNVSAVFEQPVGKSFLSFNTITSIETRKILQPSAEEYTNWGWSNFQTFVMLNRNSDPNEAIQKVISVFPEEKQKHIKSISLISLSKVYYSKLAVFGHRFIKQGDKNKVFVLLFVAVLILVIALVNFINISSSLWIERIKQTGVLKVMGASRWLIFRNVIVETFVWFITAIIIAIIMSIPVIPIIKSYTGINFNMHYFITPQFYGILLASSVIISLAFSFIPGFKISSSKVVNNLKKSLNQNSKKSVLRNGLITFQYVISIVLMAFTIVVYKQIDFGSRNLVFNQDNTVAIKITPQLNKTVLKDELKGKSGLDCISFSQFYPGKEVSSWGVKLLLNGKDQYVNFNTFSADASFFELMELELVMGRFYSDDLSTDKHKVVVNETFVKKHDLGNPIGATYSNGNNEYYEIVGVVKDFHYKSVEKKIQPLAIANNNWASYCHVNIQTSTFNQLNSHVEEIKVLASKLSPAFPVEISFLDAAVENMYISEVRFRRTFSLFAISAIIICSLGILTMSIFSCQRRIKEIGVRKVNGAKVTEILAMLNKDFVRWVLVAFTIACPIAYYSMTKWLESFAYKTELSWWIFALAGAVALLIALITVSWHSWKAAIRNPVEALKYE